MTVPSVSKSIVPALSSAALVRGVQLAAPPGTVPPRRIAEVSATWSAMIRTFRYLVSIDNAPYTRDGVLRIEGATSPHAGRSSSFRGEAQLGRAHGEAGSAAGPCKTAANARSGD